MSIRYRLSVLVCVFLFIPIRDLASQDSEAKPANKARPARARQYLKESTDWFRSEPAEKIAANILGFQSPAGLWPKNTDVVSQPYIGDPAKLEGTFDNGATFDELRFLAQAFAATGNPKYQAAVLKALDGTLVAQYPNGGWPQKVPAGKGYSRFVTFNDGAMVGIMR